MILGVGNDFRGDDAVGLFAARRLRERLPPARVIECDGDLAGIVVESTQPMRIGDFIKHPDFGHSDTGMEDFIR